MSTENTGGPIARGDDWVESNGDTSWIPIGSRRIDKMASKCGRDDCVICTQVWEIVCPDIDPAYARFLVDEHNACMILRQKPGPSMTGPSTMSSPTDDDTVVNARIRIEAKPVRSAEQVRAFRPETASREALVMECLTLQHEVVAQMTSFRRFHTNFMKMWDEKNIAVEELEKLKMGNKSNTDVVNLSDDDEQETTDKKGKKAVVQSHQDPKHTGVKRASGGKITRRGPNISGTEEFDKYCFFANDVDLNEDQVAHLTRQVANLKPWIPFYVCRMTRSTVIHGKAKMYFSSKFSIAHLKEYAPMELPVFCTSGTNVTRVTFLFDSKQDAQMSGGWPKIVKEAGIGEGDICVFIFEYPRSFGFVCTVDALN